MKEVREGYKMTELGEIPEEWQVNKINDFAEFVGSGITPKGGQSVYKTEGIPFIRSQNVYPNGLHLDDVVYIDEEQNKKMKRTEFKEYDVLLNITGASIGRCTFVPLGFGRGNVNQHVCIIRMNNIINPVYLSMYINSPIIQKQIEAFNNGSSREGLNFQQVRGLTICVPNSGEQRKIANILSTVDEQIANTESLTEKTKELKKGLMQRLLTKGIGHTEFKETEVGVIPKDWEVSDIRKIVKYLKSGLSRNLKEEDIGVPCIRSNNIVNFKINTDELKYWFLEDDKGAKIEDYFLEDGDILVNFINSIAQIGKCCIYRDIGRKVIYTTNIFRLKLDERKILQEFFYYIAQTERYNKEIGLITKPAVNQASFTTADFKNIRIQIPQLEEQKKIINILTGVDEQIDQYETQKQNLQHLKQALTQKLLTGKIRVK